MEYPNIKEEMIVCLLICIPKTNIVFDGLFYFFNGTSAFVGYLMSKP